MARKGVRFLRRGRIVERCDFAPTETLLDHLRLHERAHGTKEGCAEGDCGACTVAVGRLAGNGRVTYQPANSCILLLGMADGTEIVTVEDLAPSAGDLVPPAGDSVPLAGDSAPPVGDSVPLAGDPAPSAGDLAPSAEAHPSPVEDPALSAEVPAPSAGDPAPSAEAPAPSVEALAPSVEAPPPSTEPPPPPNDHLHPVQRAMVEAHASQCGFCTPGFVMSLFALYHAGKRADRATVNDWLAGNLCRCTGYRPIADAALACCTGEADDAFAKRIGETAGLLTGLSDSADLFAGADRTFFAAPASEDALAALCARYPDATIVGGATDVGLWITKQLRELPRIVHTGRVASLHRVREMDDRIEIGAAATYTEAEEALGGIDPDIGEMLRRLGSKQVRGAGTVGGNIANGSPIGDSPPVLIALGASIELRRGDTHRTLPLEDFFLDYGRQDRAPGEILVRITVPRLGQDEHFRCYKISKRFDQDISALLGAFRFRIRRGRVVQARIAYGGMAATPKRALAAERAAAGLRLSDPASWPAAADALAEDFSPIDDHRASAGYRMRVARSLLLKALAEIAGRPTTETRITGIRERGPGNRTDRAAPGGNDPAPPSTPTATPPR